MTQLQQARQFFESSRHSFHGRYRHVSEASQIRDKLSASIAELKTQWRHRQRRRLERELR
jgi:hypothetical protein